MPVLNWKELFRKLAHSGYQCFFAFSITNPIYVRNIMYINYCCIRETLKNEDYQINQVVLLFCPSNRIDFVLRIDSVTLVLVIVARGQYCVCMCVSVSMSGGSNT